MADPNKALTPKQIKNGHNQIRPLDPIMDAELGAGLRGRPVHKHHKTPNILKKRVKSYFKSIEPKYKDEIVKDKEGKESTVQVCIKNGKRATLTGLALYCGFHDKAGMHRFKTKEGFGEVIKTAITRVEMQYEEHLYSKTPAGAIFALKNLGWSDRQEVEHSGSIQIPGFKWANLTDKVDAETIEIEKID